TTLNRLPEAAAKEFHPTLPGPFEFDVLASDSDPDGDQLSILSVTQGEHGTVTTDGTSITYTPAPDYAGTDLFTYTISDGFGGETATTVTLRNAGAVAVTDMIATNGEVVSFDPRVNDTDADNDSLTVSGVTQGAAGTVMFSATNVTYTPGPAFLGRDSFTYTITDGTVSAIGTVLVRNTAPITVVGAVTGTQVPGEAPGTVYATIGLPTRGLFAGTLQTSGHTRLRAVFGENGEVILKSGAAAPGLVGATIANLRDLSGQAIIATLRGGGVKRSDDTALYVHLPDGSVQLAAREGGTLSPGLTLQKILSVDGNGPTIFFTAKVGGPAVGKNDVVLCGIVPGAQPQILVREGHLVGSRPVSVVGTLIGARGSLAEGRWRTGPAEIGVRLTFPGNFHALYAIPATAASPDDWTARVKTGDELPGQGHIQSFGLPGFSSDAVSYAAELVEAPLGKAKHSKNIVLARTSAAGSVVLATQSGPVPGVDATPIAGLQFKKFADPIGGPGETTAFGATLSGSGVNATNRTGLWFAGSDNKLRMIARAGDSAAGGGRWSAFRSLVLPDGAGAGPVFTASLAVRGFDAVTRQSNEGMWAFDSAGTMRLLLRTGQTVMVNGTPRSIKRFVALAPAFATPNGSAVGFDEDGHVTATATLNDGSHALLHIVIP
ncbi:MAG TPA: Ig-like domain-containing protein, partial [Chthoniobacteraceae bacterium]|nr:Ig-like domain-containing protein [Chthoniobacteraceae bacterium]